MKREGVMACALALGFFILVGAAAYVAKSQMASAPGEVEASVRAPLPEDIPDEGGLQAAGSDCISAAPEGRDGCCLIRNRYSLHPVCPGAWRFAEGGCRFVCDEDPVREPA
jgi:hypothetical protein